MKIAAYLDEDGAVSGFHAPGSLFLFHQESTRWVLEKCVAFEIEGERTLASLKRALAVAAAAVAPCRVLLADPVHGTACAILQQEFGFRLWRSHGPVMEQLDHVARREAEAAPAGPLPPAPQPLGPPEAGHQVFDLEAAFLARPDLNSRDLLVPILEAGTFRVLEIRCDHPPRWMAQALDMLGLSAQISGADSLAGPVVVRVEGPPPPAEGEVRPRRVLALPGCCG